MLIKQRCQENEVTCSNWNARLKIGIVWAVWGCMKSTALLMALIYSQYMLHTVLDFRKEGILGTGIGWKDEALLPLWSLIMWFNVWQWSRCIRGQMEGGKWHRGRQIHQHLERRRASNTFTVAAPRLSHTNIFSNTKQAWAAASVCRLYARASAAPRPHSSNIQNTTRAFSISPHEMWVIRSGAVYDIHLLPNSSEASESPVRRCESCLRKQTHNLSEFPQT